MRLDLPWPQCLCYVTFESCIHYTCRVQINASVLEHTGTLCFPSDISGIYCCRMFILIPCGLLSKASFFLRVEIVRAHVYTYRAWCDSFLFGICFPLPLDVVLASVF